MDNKNSPTATNNPKPPDNWWTRLLGYTKRRIDERKTNKQKESPTDRAARITATATVWIAVFTVVLAVVGGITLFEVIEGGTDTHDLAVAMKRSADLAQSQQIPWLGIEQPDSMPVKFSYLWRDPMPYPTINFDIHFLAKNYGTFPAHLVPYQISTLSLDATPENDSKSVRKTCGIDAYRTPGQVTLPKDPGEALLPGATRPFNFGIVDNFGGKVPKELTALSFTVCLVYQDARRTWHYSGYRYRASGIQTVKVPGHPDWSYTQFTQSSLLASDAE